MKHKLTNDITDLMYNFNFFNYYKLLGDLKDSPQQLEIKKELDKELLKFLTIEYDKMDTNYDSRKFCLEWLFNFMPYYHELSPKEKLNALSFLILNTKQYFSFGDYFKDLLQDLIHQQPFTITDLISEFGNNCYRYVEESIFKLLPNGSYDYIKDYFDYCVNNSNQPSSLVMYIEPSLHHSLTSSHYKIVYKKLANIMNESHSNYNGSDLKLIMAFKGNRSRLIIGKQDINISYTEFVKELGNLRNNLPYVHEFLEITGYLFPLNKVTKLKEETLSTLDNNIDYTVLNLTSLNTQRFKLLKQEFENKPSYLQYKTYIKEHSCCNKIGDELEFSVRFPEMV